MYSRDIWLGFSQLKADASHIAMGRTVLETKTSESWLQYYFRSCWVRSILCCAFPLFLATSCSSISETGAPRCVFYCDAKRCSSNEAWIIYCHTDTHFSICTSCVPLEQWCTFVSWVSHLSDSATWTHSGYKKLGWSQSEPILPK